MKLDIKKIARTIIRGAIGIGQFLLFLLLFCLPSFFPAFQFSKFSIWYLVLFVPTYLILYSTIDIYDSFKEKRFVLKSKYGVLVTESIVVSLIFYVLLYTYVGSDIHGVIERMHATNVSDVVIENVITSGNPLEFEKVAAVDMVDSSSSAEKYLAKFITYDIIPTDTLGLEWMLFIRNSKSDFKRLRNTRSVDSKGVVRDYDSETDTFSVSECLGGKLTSIIDTILIDSLEGINFEPFRNFQ